MKLPRALRWLQWILPTRKRSVIQIEGKPFKGYSKIAWSYRSRGQQTVATQLINHLFGGLL